MGSEGAAVMPRQRLDDLGVGLPFLGIPKCHGRGPGLTLQTGSLTRPVSRPRRGAQLFRPTRGSREAHNSVTAARTSAWRRRAPAERCTTSSGSGRDRGRSGWGSRVVDLTRGARPHAARPRPTRGKPSPPACTPAAAPVRPVSRASPLGPRWPRTPLSRHLGKGGDGDSGIGGGPPYHRPRASSRSGGPRAPAAPRSGAPGPRPGGWRPQAPLPADSRHVHARGGASAGRG